jgi:hypothetical protein
MVILSKRATARDAWRRRRACRRGKLCNWRRGTAIARTKSILAYFDVSHVVSGVIAPMLDDEKQLIGAYFAESTADAFFDTPPNSKEQPLAVRVTDWLAAHTGKALRAPPRTITRCPSCR